ncbi:hypothetical protein [Undibacterium sp.]|uniref:hypothetical protein n=1 Tax=Undibacterium sp. TaxID=1914977 RepID=UPI0037533205
MSNHTPGEWTINANKIDGDGYHLASINSHATTIGIANARLIAAAPGLLEALTELLQCLEYVYRSHPEITGKGKALADMQKARAAIEKATS